MYFVKNMIHRFESRSFSLLAQITGYEIWKLNESLKQLYMQKKTQSPFSLESAMTQTTHLSVRF